MEGSNDRHDRGTRHNDKRQDTSYTTTPVAPQEEDILMDALVANNKDQLVWIIGTV